MKTFLCALGCVLALSINPVLAQDKGAPQLTSAEWLAKIQADKKGIVAKSMNLTPDEAKKFWPLYDEFQRALAVPQSAYTRAVLDYVAAGTTLTDANAKRLSEQVLGASQGRGATAREALQAVAEGAARAQGGALHADREQDAGGGALRSSESDSVGELGDAAVA